MTGTCKRAIVVAFSVILGFSLLSSAPPAGADTSYANMSITDLREELDKLEADQRDLATQRATSEETMKAATEQLASTQAQIADQRERLEQLEAQISQIALQQYQDRGLNTTAMLMASSSSDDLIGYMTMVQQVTDTANCLYTSLQLTQGTMTDLERAERAAVETIKQEQARLEALDAEAKAKVAQVSSLLDSMRNYAAYPGGSYGLNAIGVGVSNPEELVPFPSATLVTPMRTFLVTSPFGMRIHPFTGGWAFHDGIDLAAACGTYIYAPANGFVMDYYWAGGYGNRLVIDHGIINGKHVVTSYNHLSGAIAYPGTNVLQRDPIALVGSTGDSTGCHLHYMVWMNGQIVDPTPYT